jgi:hypothetical protein
MRPRWCVDVGLLKRLVLLPLAPVEGVLWLTRAIHEVAERELNDPTILRQRLYEAQLAYEHGEISQEELDQIEELIVGRLLDPRVQRLEVSDG